MIGMYDSATNSRRRDLTFPVCNLCPKGEGLHNLCSKCYNDEGTVCLNEDHQLYKSDRFMDSSCSRATSESLNVSCDRQDCRKVMKGLYFRKQTNFLMIMGCHSHFETDCCRCDGDDFDICLQCVTRGRDCRDKSHWLKWAIAPIDITSHPR